MRSNAGVLSAVQNLSSEWQDAFYPESAVDADGDAVFAWLRYTAMAPTIARPGAGA